MQWAYSSVAQPIEGKGFADRCSNDLSHHAGSLSPNAIRPESA
jgi:hypothetical protein